MTDEPHSSELHWLDGMVPIETLRTAHMCGRRAPPLSCVRKWARVHRGSTHAVRVLPVTASYTDVRDCESLPVGPELFPVVARRVSVFRRP